MLEKAGLEMIEANKLIVTDTMYQPVFNLNSYCVTPIVHNSTEFQASGSTQVAPHGFPDKGWMRSTGSKSN